MASILLSQSLSLPSQISVPVTVQGVSQPLDSSLSLLMKPFLQLCTLHLLPSHLATALASRQALPHLPQFCTSVARVKVSSILPLQSLSLPSHSSVLLVKVQEYSQPLDLALHPWDRSRSMS